MHAFAADLADTVQVKCVILDVSAGGCRIFSSRLHELPDVIQLIPEALGSAIKGVVVWRKANMAGMCFEHACSDEQRTEIAVLFDAASQGDEDEIWDLGEVCTSTGFAERLEKLRG